MTLTCQKLWKKLLNLRTLSGRAISPWYIVFVSPISNLLCKLSLGKVVGARRRGKNANGGLFDEMHSNFCPGLQNGTKVGNFYNRFKILNAGTRFPTLLLAILLGTTCTALGYLLSAYDIDVFDGIQSENRERLSKIYKDFGSFFANRLFFD